MTLRAVWIAFVFVLGVANAQAASVDDFFGRYMGRSISSTETGLTKRDLSVVIEKRKNGGFHLEWTTLTHKKDGRVKRKAYAINFTASEREGIYASAMRRDTFGNRVPLNPLKGEPYVWARINADTLTVYAMIITEDGGYEVQVYERTRTTKGMDLRFSRLRNGVPLKEITGTLVKY